METIKRKQTKSRNGCVTCKVKRRKCDETKPGCEQCSRRKIECGGYENGLRWKHVERLENDGRKMKANPSERGRRQTSSESDKIRMNEDMMEIVPHLNNNSSPQGSLGVVDGQGNRLLPNSGTDSASSYLAPVDSERPPLQDLLSMTSVFNLNQWRMSFPPSSSDPVGRHIDAERMSNSPPIIDPKGLISDQITDLDQLLSSTDVIVNHLESPQQQPYFHSILTAHGNSDAAIHLVDDDDGDDGHSNNVEDTHWHLLYSRSAPEDDFPQGEDFAPWCQQPYPVNGEPIEHLFDHATAEFLSVVSDYTVNPWKTLVWPLADACPALYYALAAMACFYLSGLQPELRDAGIQYFENSLQEVAGYENSGSMPLETTAIATRLALALAESRHPEQSSTGISHINMAGELIQNVISENQISNLDGTKLNCLTFLTNTWVYLNVTACLSCAPNAGSTHVELMETCILMNPGPSRNIDSLMGCASTLFPMIGRLTDMVRRVRGRTQKRNSPAIISQALNLRIAMEHWSPPISVEEPVENISSSTISEIVQIAEAYRWAALLTLRQAVPELPWVLSFWDMAQKVMVFLATIPNNSRTLIIQIFPMIVAGCEAVEEEDREWVDERWALISKRMEAGIVDQCKKITHEVWRRRDAHAANHKSCRFSRPEPLFNNVSPPTTETAAACNGCIKAENDSFSSDFPDSAAFRKGIDPFTRAGSIRYTVRGDLHWLGVMQDWKWEAMLG